MITTLRMRISPFSLLLQFGCLVFTANLFAQAPAPAPAAPKNMVGNPSFETGFRRDNLWDGVDSTGSLAIERGALPVLTTSGAIADTSMPASVSIADLNGDGLPDIASMDVLGYLRVFFNAGSKTEPKFTQGEMANIFLSRINPATDPTLQGLNVQRDDNARRGQRIHLADLSRSGKKDLVIGNYLGEILLIPNAGSGARPDYRQPSSMATAIIPTTKNSLKKWGNVFAPAIWDWNKDGKEDLLVGEGSYSANSIHLLLNQGTGSKPTFDENNRSVLAYGMGLEQLTPCVVDYNGDGHPDLLVTERTGKVAIYLNPGKAWKAGETLPFDSFLTVGGAKPAAAGKDPMDAAKNPAGLLTVGGIATIAADDMNGDGLFDLVFGKSNGKIAMSLNSGTKTEPKFAAPVELKGDAGTPAFNSPSGWDCNFGLDRGNFYGFFSVVKAADDPEAKPTEGTACLKAGYAPSPNKFLPVPTQYSPAANANWKQRAWYEENQIKINGPANCFILKQSGRGPLKNRTTYSFSMKVKGAKVNDASVGIFYRGFKKLSEAKIERGDRNSAKVTRNEAEERKMETANFTAGSGWSDVKKEFSVKFDDKDLQDLTHVSDWFLSVVFTLSPGQAGGALYIDDVKVIEK
ncbi:MAG: VCBS repeat-containing protein [Chthoniobacterales bacterium]|nr:VCBS repeat-containing protein [Chthoniobacterales bacterium]